MSQQTETALVRTVERAAEDQACAPQAPVKNTKLSLAELEAEQAAAKEHLQDLRQREETAQQDIARAEEAVKAASVAMAATKEAGAAEEFRESTRHLAEARAVAAAFAEHVIPAAVARLGDLETAVGAGRVRERNDAACDLVWDKLVPLTEQYQAHLNSAAVVLAQIESARAQVLGTAMTLTRPQDNCLRDREMLAWMLPDAIMKLAKDAYLRRPDHEWPAALRSLFRKGQ